MKRLGTAIIVALNIGLIVAGALYLISALKPQQPQNYTEDSTLQYLTEIGRAKYESSLLSAHYADIATKEQRVGTSRLLKAIAKAETIQCENCIRAIRILGGSSHLPKQHSFNHISTHRHLHSIIEQKSALHQQHTSHLIKYTADRNNMYVARLLTWCDASDIHQIRFIQRELSHFDSTLLPQPRKYYVCPRCSYICDDEFISHLCHYCMTPFAEFIVFD